MKYLRLATAALISTTTLSSCFKAEPLNAECDIEQAYVNLQDPISVFFQESDTLVDVLSTSRDIKFIIRKNVDRKNLAPMFRLTAGATISPESGSAQDFSGQPVKYTVTSEDGCYHKDYLVSFNYSKDILEYYFDHYALNTTPAPANKYYEWTDISVDSITKDTTVINKWGTGNSGFRMSKSSAAADEYPTTPASEPGHETCVKLTTCSTGSWGSRMKMPIAAGNIFLGEFDISKALVANAAGVKGVLATKFGIPVSSQPVSFSYSYKYKRGETITDKNNNEVAGKKDYGSIYAVFYDNHDEDGLPFVLHGDDVLSSNQIISIANLGQIDDTDGWVQRNVDFQLCSGKAIDPVKLANKGYSLAIVASSSVNGASFEGAIGSTLWIDDFSIKCANAE